MGTSHGEALAVLQYEEFFQELREEGFVVGVGHYLRAQRLLDAVGATEPEAVESLLCPIFATSAEQQLRFHTLFQRAFPTGHDEAEPALPDTGRRRRPSLAALVLTGEHASVRRLFPSERRLAAALVVVLVIAAVAVGKGLFPYDGTPANPPDTVVQPPTRGTTSSRGDNLVPELAVIAPPAVSIEAPKPQPQPAPDNTRRAWLSLIPFLLLAGVELWRRHRERAVAERQAGVKPPYTWPVRVENASAALFVTPEFLQASRTVRRRQRSPDLRFAVRPSIQATIEARGFPTFRYEQGTRPPEYLTLIERTGPSDHQARHFDALARALAVEGAFVSRYFYEHDPRVCFAEEAMSGIRLAELHRRLPSDRVLVFGTGTGFLDPIYGRPLPWLSLLQDWDELALLTPVPPAKWGAREVALAGEMLVLPATLEGLRATIDHFDAGSEPDLRVWYERDRDSIRVDDHDDVTPSELRRALGDDLFRWVAACAVYPELLWDLTLFLGSRDEVGRGLITERNVLTIARLSWFRRGAFPEPLRLGLLKQLEAMDQPHNRSTERAVRELLEKILEGEALDPESMAGRAHRRELLHQRLYLYREDPARFQQALRDLQREATAEELVQDVTVMRLLRSAPASPLSLALPKTVRDRFFPGGMPELGLTRLARTGLTCVAAAAIWFAAKPEPTAAPPLVAPAGSLVPSAIALSVPRGFRFQLGVADTAGRSVAQGVVWTSTADSVVRPGGRAQSGAGEADFTGRAAGTTTVRAAVGTTAVDVAVTVGAVATPRAGVLGPPRVLPPGRRGRITWPTVDLAGTPSNALQASEREPPSIESCDSSVVRVEPRNALYGVRAGSAVVVNHQRSYDYAVLVRVPGTAREYHSPGGFTRPLDANKILTILPMHELAAFLRGDSAVGLTLTAVVGTTGTIDSAVVARAVTTALNDSVSGAASKIRFTTRAEKATCDLGAFTWALAGGWLDRVDIQPITRQSPRVIPPDEGWVYLGDYDAKQWKTRYFTFPTSATPADVVGRTLGLSGTAPSINVRNSPESFPSTAPGRDVLRTGDSVHVLEVRRWGTTTYQWGRVRYWHAAQTAQAKPRPKVATRAPQTTQPGKAGDVSQQAPLYVVVPDVRGLTRERARATLSTARLSEYVADTVITKDTIEAVVAQRPPAGTRVEAGSDVTLTLGRPAGGVPLPPPDVGQQAPGDSVNQHVPNEVYQQAPNDANQQAPSDVYQQAPNDVSQQGPLPADTTTQARGVSRSDSAFAKGMLEALLGKYSSDMYQAALRRLAQGRSRAELISGVGSNSKGTPGDQGFLRRLWRLVKCEEPSARELANLSGLEKKLGSRANLVRYVLEDSNVRSTWEQCVGGQPYQRPATAN